jgi:hypothetical protein
MQHSFIYRHRIVTIHMRRHGEQWMSREQLEGTLLGEGRHTGTAQLALHEASQGSTGSAGAWVSQAGGLTLTY